MRNWYFQHWKDALTSGISVIITFAYIIFVIIKETNSVFFDFGILILLVALSSISLITPFLKKSSKHSFDIIIFDYDEIITWRLFKKKVYKWDDVMEVGLRHMDLSEGASKKFKEKLAINVLDADGNYDAVYMDNRRAIKEVIGEHYDLDSVDLEKVRNTIL